MTIDQFLRIFEETNRKLPMTLLRDGYIRHLQEDTEYCPITAVASRKLTKVPIEPFRPMIFDAVYAEEWGLLLGLEIHDTEAIQMAADGDIKPDTTPTQKALRKRLEAIVRSGTSGRKSTTGEKEPPTSDSRAHLDLLLTHS